ncbi:hypothetical protein GALMADRAFT_76946 [Galerina marginata CBS 339.88]|uniref:Major facilitator superfamily (MFS) profile domain-containing protein n=1 Tax=Galerina marginata (strain CBS 339.88) TaxID=685588 RepID=A0A067SIA0_GALM3|nr:hypothetical protein GALMADRAFT_76946 [Galerina marginata CBS 339.88]
MDEAHDILASNGKVIHIVTAEEDSRLLWKIDRHLMPIMFCIYILQMLDKQTLSLTSVFGLSKDTGLSGHEYSMLGSIVNIAQLAMQPLSAYLLVRLRISAYVPAILGVFEASIQSAFILIIQTWYRRREQGFRIAVFYSNMGWANILGGLMMFGLGHIRSGALHTYQIVFIFLGGVTALVGLLSFYIFPENPVRCKFLTTEEKVMAVERIRANQQGLETKDFKIKQVWEMLLDLKSWCWMFLMLTLSIAAIGFAVFTPLVMEGFGFNRYDIMLLLIPHGVLQLIFLFGGFWLNRRFGLKSPIILGGLLPCIVAATIFLKSGRSPQDRPVLLFAYYALAVGSVIPPTIVNWQSSNVAGHTKKSATAAFTSMGFSAGAIVGPLLFSPKDKPYFRRGITAMVICYSVAAVLVLFTVVYLRYLNRVNKTRRIASGKAGNIVDYSMLSAAQAEQRRLNEMMSAGTAQATGSRAFDDLTDLENEEFIVSSRFSAMTWRG